MVGAASRADNRYASPQILDWLARARHRADAGLSRAFAAPAQTLDRWLEFGDIGLRVRRLVQPSSFA